MFIKATVMYNQGSISDERKSKLHEIHPKSEDLGRIQNQMRVFAKTNPAPYLFLCLLFRGTGVEQFFQFQQIYFFCKNIAPSEIGGLGWARLGS
jgi:hypothetical protein